MNVKGMKGPSPQVTGINDDLGLDLFHA